MSWTEPPAASIFSRALAVKASAATKSWPLDLALAEDLDRLAQACR